VNVEDILNEWFSCSSDSNFVYDNEIEELLLVLEPALFVISQFESIVETPPALGKAWDLSPPCRWVM
jgi:hypothetical protein